MLFPVKLWKFAFNYNFNYLRKSNGVDDIACDVNGDTKCFKEGC